MPRRKNVSKVKNKNKINVVVNVNSHNRKKVASKGMMKTPHNNSSMPPIIIHPAPETSVANGLLALQRQNMDVRHSPPEPQKQAIFKTPVDETTGNNLITGNNNTETAHATRRNHLLDYLELQAATTRPKGASPLHESETSSQFVSSEPLPEPGEMKNPDEELHHKLKVETQEIGTNPPKQLTRTEINIILEKYKDPVTKKKFTQQQVRALKDFDAWHLYNTITLEGQEKPVILKK